jgi:hypothetical protein
MQPMGKSSGRVRRPIVFRCRRIVRASRNAGDPVGSRSTARWSSKRGAHWRRSLERFITKGNTSLVSAVSPRSASWSCVGKRARGLWANTAARIASGGTVSSHRVCPSRWKLWRVPRQGARERFTAVSRAGSARRYVAVISFWYMSTRWSMVAWYVWRRKPPKPV